MKNFLRNIIILVLGFGAIVAFMEYLFKDNFNFIHDKFQSANEDDSSKILLLGNSHMMALRTPIINNMSAFNFGVGGQDIYHMLLITEKVLEGRQKKFEYIILGLDYDLLGYNFQIANTAWMDRLYYPDTKKTADNTLGGRLMAKSNFFRGNRNFQEAFKSFRFSNSAGPSQDQIKKAERTNEAFADKNSSCKSRALEHSVHKFDRSLIDENLVYLESLSQLCEKHGVQLIFINYPKKDCYYDFYSDGVVSLVAPKIIDFCKKHDITFLDYWRSEQFTDDMYVDNDHFNEYGANTMIRILETLIK